MTTISLQLEDDLSALLRATNQSVQRAAREFIILELYRRGTISSGKAAELLQMARWEFVRYASRLGIAFFDMTDEEWQTEQLQAQTESSRSEHASCGVRLSSRRSLDRTFGELSRAARGVPAPRPCVVEPFCP
jgi:predicted HTH domain antitoxin